MSEPIVCTFIYSSQEFGRALRHHFRAKTLPLLGFAALFFFLMLGGSLFDQYNAGKLSEPNVISWFGVVYFVGWHLVATGIFFLLFLPMMYFITRRVFRGSPLCGKTISFTFSDAGVKMDSPQLQSQHQWEIFSCIREYHNGFMLLMGKSKRQFYWLPKHGFSSPEILEQGRDMMRNHSGAFEVH